MSYKNDVLYPTCSHRINWRSLGHDLMVVFLVVSGLPSRSVVIDINNDGFNDLVGVGNGEGTLFLNDGRGVSDPCTLAYRFYLGNDIRIPFPSTEQIPHHVIVTHQQGRLSRQL